MNGKNLHRAFKAFADPNRLRILHILTHGERCVCDLMAVLKMGQSKVSRHLAYLKQGGLVRGRRDGLWIHYSLIQPKSDLQKKLFECLGTCLNEAPVFDLDIAFLKAIEKKRQQRLVQNASFPRKKKT